MKELVVYLARALVDDPSAVQVDESTQGAAIRYEIRCAPGDIGKIIGREGRTVKALRTLVAAAAQKNGQKAELDVVDGEERPRERRDRGEPGGRGSRRR